MGKRCIVSFVALFLCSVRKCHSLEDNDTWTLLQMPTPTAPSTPVTTTTRQTITKSRNLLYDQLFRDYRKQVRPVCFHHKLIALQRTQLQWNATAPVNVTVQFYMKQLMGVSESENQLTVYFWLELVSCFARCEITPLIVLGGSRLVMGSVVLREHRASARACPRRVAARPARVQYVSR